MRRAYTRDRYYGHDYVGRVDTGEKWRNRLRDIVTSPVPQLEEKDDYEVLFKEILPKQFWGLASSEEPRQDVALPFKIVKKVRSLCYFSMSSVALHKTCGGHIVKAGRHCG